MEYRKLKELATISISNVDKKTAENEKTVRLCNFVDVYRNWAITENMIPNFMIASAKENEIEKYALYKGDVCITKDSETKDDIGMSTYIADDIDGLVLGYHCALISPDKSVLDGKYLNAFLQTDFVRKFYELNASGSGQRYTLSLDAIGEIPIPVISLEEQKRKGELLSLIDRKIENNNKINDNLAQYANMIYDYWFTQFDFPDSKEKPYKSSGGAMTFSSVLGKDIPIGWNVVPLGNIAKMCTESITPQAGTIYKHYSIPAFDDSKLPKIEDGAEIDSSKYLVPSNTILVSKLNPQFKRIWFVNEADNTSICSTEFLPFCNYGVPVEYLHGVLNSAAYHKYMIQCSSSSTGSRKRMPPELCLTYNVVLPPISVMEAYSNKLRSVLEHMSNLLYENASLKATRNHLLPLLMSGQATIAD